MKKTDKKTVTPTIEIAPSFPTMSSFTIKATIPTGAYSNISPEMTFTDCSFDDVENTIMPKMEEMFAKYLGYNDRVTEMLKQEKLALQVKGVECAPAPVVQQNPTTVVDAPQDNVPPVAPTVSPSMANALAVIESAKTIPALETMKRKIADSVKLTVDEQNTLNTIIDEKLGELMG